MAYQKILDQKQSTYGSPYCIYTVEVQPSSRTENSVKLKVKVTSHLKYSDSYLHDGNALTGKLLIEDKDAISIPIKASDAIWNGTTEHTATKTATVTAGVIGATVALKAVFSVSSTAPGHSSGLDSVRCTNVTIPVFTSTTGIRIDSGSSLSKYKCYIDNGSTWVEYIPYIDNGTSFVKY